MSQDIIEYPALIDNAMRSVVRDVLRRAASIGLPGDHHFYVSFGTSRPGVVMSDTLKSKYPEEITIVLQHQFWDFRVEDDRFHVTLSFGGVPEKLTVPFAAMTAFADPSVKFGLQFQDGSIFEAAAVPVEVGMAPAEKAAAVGAEVISLDAFRKK